MFSFRSVVTAAPPVSIELLAGGWGVVMSMSPLLQVRRILIRRSSSDVSLGYLAVLLVGFSLYLLYGLSIGNWVLIVTNCISVVVTVVTISVATAFRAGDRFTRRAAARRRSSTA